MRDYSISACQKHRDLVLRMADSGSTLAAIARAVGTSGRHVRTFLRREGVNRSFPKSFSGDRNPKWRGGRHVHRSGYVLLYCPNHPHPNACGIYVFEHRLVMEKVLGRYLLPGEVVHHKNKDKLDNRPDNLELFQKNSDHLAKELKGKVPRWTDDGLLRMRAGVLRSAAKKREQKRLRLLALDEKRSPQKSSRSQGKSQITQQFLSGMERLQVPVQSGS